MRIDSSGNVGIGTASPSSYYSDNLVVSAPSEGGITLASTNTTNGNYLAFADGTSGDARYRGLVGYNHNVDSLLFYSAGAERMRINSSGNVGIGTASPDRLLTLQGDNSYMWMKDAGGGNVAFIGGDGSNDGFLRLYNGSHAAKVEIQSDGVSYFNGGNVGIGTASPNMKVNISHADQDGLRFNTANDAETFIDFGDTDDNDIGRISYDHADNHMAFRTFNSERLRITDVGNIAYGVTSVSSVLTGKTLQVGYGQISSDHVAYNYNTNFTNNAYQSGNDATWSAITSRASGVIKLLEDKFIFMNASSGTAGQAVSMTERMRIDSSGNMMVGKTAVGASTLGAEMRPDGFVGSAKASSANGSITFGAYSTTASQYQFYVGMAGTIYARATSISSLSDERRKENIVDLETGLPEVMALKPRRFDWKDGSETNVAGFIAQEVETVLPDLIGEWEDENNDDLKSVKMGDMLPTLVKAIQEQQEQIEQLKAEIQTLKGE